jgi:hypothetical protein
VNPGTRRRTIEGGGNPLLRSRLILRGLRRSLQRPDVPLLQFGLSRLFRHRRHLGGHAPSGFRHL